MFELLKHKQTLIMWSKLSKLMTCSKLQLTYPKLKKPKFLLFTQSKDFLMENHLVLVILMDSDSNITNFDKKCRKKNFFFTRFNVLVNNSKILNFWELNL